MKRLLVVTLCLLSLQAVAADYYGDLVVEKYISAYDGDTFRVDVADIHPLIGRNMPIRLRGVDTPEIRGKCDQEKALAIKARDFVRELLANAETIVLKNIDRGKYFRIVADVSVDGVDLGSTLIENGLGRLYDGGKKVGWCDG
jgi:endonuclease YncB( thermonuclease family)